MLDLEIVDAHHHLWDLRNSYPWLQEAAGQLQVHGDDSAIRRGYLLTDYLADAKSLNLVGSVHVDAGAADGRAETRWLQGISDQDGFPHAIVAGAALDAPHALSVLEELAEQRSVRGVRHILNWHPDPTLTYIDRNDLMTDASWLHGFRALAPLGLSFDLQVYPGQLAEAARLAAGHPDTSIILNHAGMLMGRSPEAFDEWRRGMRALAAHPNVTVKVSGIGMTDHQWTIDSLRPVVLDTIGAFGTDRAMFGSNFPVDSLYSTLEALYDAYDAITADFTPAERTAMFGGNAKRVYRL